MNITQPTRVLTAHMYILFLDFLNLFLPSPTKKPATLTAGRKFGEKKMLAAIFYKLVLFWKEKKLSKLLDFWPDKSSEIGHPNTSSFQFPPLGRLPVAVC